ncbi:alpha/beta hydrolase [Duganella radicis]|uniref:Alpha/beta fold hydrolase n=1 Tax=Duganella radicis TaxID=551988 RepID=A0A6L6PE07_9BURK|nr:alpha/beta fold hydrolase [Duganella radicis]MTV36575.1 alpha/beta fold hydrolase [Duganella radicis]
MRDFRIMVASAVLLGAAGHVPAAAEETLLCIRGQSFVPGRELLQTRQLKMHTEGAPLGDLALPVAQRGVREKIWPELTLDEVKVAAFDEQLCGKEPAAELSITITDEDYAEIRAELNRGESDIARLNDVVRQAGAKAVPVKPFDKGTSVLYKRHDWVHLYFATSRDATNSSRAADAFGKLRSDKLTFGAVDISIPSDHRWAKLESPSVWRFDWDANPQRHVVMADGFQILSESKLKSELAQRASAFNKPGVLLFVHGFNNSFEQAAQRAAQLTYDLAFPGPTILYSWPSNGDVLSYMSDEEKARSAWRQMAAVLDQLTSLGPGVPVYIVAHSMGNRVFTQGMAELLRRRPGADKVVRQVVLASPDIGEQEFRERWLYELKSASPTRYTLYASNQDLPVAVSAWLHGERRLGSGGSGIAVFSGLDSIDASAITEEWFGLSHSYFGDNATVMSDLFMIINQGLEPAKRPRLSKASGTRGTYWEFKP